jgi:hypothetical protein
MYYMKRTKITTLENSGTHIKKNAAAKISKEENPAAFKKSVVTAKKTGKLLKTGSAAKTAVSTPKTKESVFAKVTGHARPAPPKKKTAAADEKGVKKSKPAASVKASAPTPKAKKSGAVNAVSKPKKEKIDSTVSGKKSKPQKEQILPLAAGKKVKAVEKKAEIAASLSKPKLDKTARTNEKKTAKNPVKKIKIAVPAPPSKAVKKIKNVEKKAEIVIPALTPKPVKKASAAGKKTEKKVERKVERKVEIVIPKINSKSNKNVRPAEKKVEIVIPPITVKPVKKKIKPISSAVVRGKNGRYDFEVFPLDAELKDGSAIYVISKRITDRRGRGHHKFVCIGQTESLIGEIKKHKKDKCIKQYSANVICLLREESAANRLKIETDLREAHSIACNQK